MVSGVDMDAGVVLSSDATNTVSSYVHVAAVAGVCDPVFTGVVISTQSDAFITSSSDELIAVSTDMHNFVFSVVGIIVSSGAPIIESTDKLIAASPDASPDACRAVFTSDGIAAKSINSRLSN